MSLMHHLLTKVKTTTTFMKVLEIMEQSVALAQGNQMAKADWKSWDFLTFKRYWFVY